MKETKRVVVTAMGAMTSQGAGVEALWHGVRSGKVAIEKVRGLPMTGYATDIGGEVTAEQTLQRAPGIRQSPRAQYRSVFASSLGFNGLRAFAQ